MYCIYMHKNLINNKIYIGMTNDVKRRWRNGGIEYHSCVRFYQAIKKYGFDSFAHIILKDNLTKDQAYKLEKHCIKLYRSNDKEIGYNISEGGNGGKVYDVHPRNMLGKSQTIFQKENQRALMNDKNFNPMKNGACIWSVTHSHPKGMKGKHHTAEHNQELSKKMKDKKINCKPVKVIYPDGREEMFTSIGEAQEIGVSRPVILKMIRSGKPYKIKVVNQYTRKIKHLEGICIKYVDNTEVIKGIKEPLTP